MNDTRALAAGALSASIHTFRILVNRGLVSPNEVEGFFLSVTEMMREANVETAEEFEGRTQSVFADLRRLAQQRWIGDGHANPEPNPSERR